MPGYGEAPDEPPRNDAVDDTPTVACARCDREWDLTYELDSLQVGNQALEQFALDHKRHTGHYPDDVVPWQAVCRHCPGGEEFLSERPARRWAEIHARHTRHEIELHHSSDEPAITIGPSDIAGGDLDR
ncbi:hypothetical protein ACNS7O_17055 (plasmid) [Haloferacaceae archaeon DSL9]